MIICEGEGNVDVLLIRNKSAFLIWSPKISAEVKKSVKTSENQCTPAFKIKQDKWGQGNWALERCKKPNQNNELQQPTGLYGSRRKNSPWPLWCSRAAWDPSPCFPKHKVMCSPPAPGMTSLLWDAAGRGALAPQERAAAAAGALPLGAPWVQWGRTASAAEPGAGQLCAASGAAVIEAAVSLVFVTDWQPRRAKCCSHRKDAESKATVAAHPCSRPACTCLGFAWLLLVAGEPLASLCCYVTCWDWTITRHSK